MFQSALTRGRVRIGDRQTPENPALQAFHLFGVAVVLVVITEQMQKSVDGEVGQMVVERLALGNRLAGGSLVRDNDVPDIWGRPAICRRFAAVRPAAPPGMTARWWPRFCRASRD